MRTQTRSPIQTAAVRSRTLDHLPALERMLATEGDFLKTWTYFLDHFAENEGFLRRGRPVERADVAVMISRMVAQVLNCKPLAVETTLLETPGSGFVHGASIVEDHVVGVFYFDRIGMGMIALTRWPNEGRTVVARFSCLSHPQAGCVQ